MRFMAPIGMWLAMVFVMVGAAWPQNDSGERPGTLELKPEDNLLQNAGFEKGERGADGWRTFALRREGLSFGVDDTSARSGERSVWVQNNGDEFGTWQQVVPVEAGAIYVFSGWLKLRDLGRRSEAKLQVAFRDEAQRILEFAGPPPHNGTTEWMYDLPHELNLRAPERATSAEVNLFLRGPGTVWFDDVFFGPAPSGGIGGVVTRDGQAVAGVKVAVYGTDFSATTDEQGRYRIENVPVASPRYIVIATKDGYNNAAAGDIDVNAAESAEINFELREGDNRCDTDLRVKCARLRRCDAVRPEGVSADAVIDPALYPEAVRVYLEPSEAIDTGHPLVKATAQDILEGVPVEQRNDLRTVAFAVYSWIVRNIEYDVVYDPPGRGRGNQFVDATSGKWQTITPQGWCWGHNFEDWLYKVSEMLQERRGICIEHGRIAAGLLRAVGIPARPVAPYQAQFWVQMPDGSGYWSAMGTSGGRKMYRERGNTDGAVGQLSPSNLQLFPIDAGGVIHSDWWTENKCLWREVHPWGASYPDTAEGRAAAMADMATFAKTGEDPQRLRTRGRGGHDRPTAEEMAQLPPPPGQPRLVVDYSDFTLNLTNIGDQRLLRARFPFAVATEHISINTEDCAYWTNQPEWAKRTWVSEETNPRVAEKREWFNIEFDFSALFDG